MRLASLVFFLALALAIVNASDPFFMASSSLKFGDENRDILRINFCTSLNGTCLGADVPDYPWPLPLSSPAVVNAFGQLHVFYDCMPNPNDISSQTGVCHLFYMDGAASFEVLDATWSSGKYISATLQGSQLHVFSHIAHGGLRWGSYTAERGWRWSTISTATGLCYGTHTSTAVNGDYLHVFGFSLLGGICHGTYSQYADEWIAWDLIDADQGTGLHTAAICFEQILTVANAGRYGGVRACMSTDSKDWICSTADGASSGLHSALVYSDGLVYLFSQQSGGGLRVCESVDSFEFEECTLLDDGLSFGAFVSAQTDPLTGQAAVMNQPTPPASGVRVLTLNQRQWSAQTIDVGGSFGSFSSFTFYPPAIKVPDLSASGSSSGVRGTKNHSRTLTADEIRLARSEVARSDSYVTSSASEVKQEAKKTKPAGRLGSKLTSGSAICISQVADSTVAYAARELQRYIYLRTGALLAITPNLFGVYCVVSISYGNDTRFWNALSVESDTIAALASLGPEEHATITLLPNSNLAFTVLAGGDCAGVTYSVFAWAEEALGIRFHLHEDVIPQEQLSWADIPALDSFHSPLFTTRGMHPFHDFFDGPDLWNAGDYIKYLGQMSKMRMNFFGLHSYPDNYNGAEPTVWIGAAADFSVRSNGAVNFTGIGTGWQSSLRGTWGMAAINTSNYAFGLASLFPADCFGDDVTAAHCPLPTTEPDYSDTINLAAELLQESFAFADLVNVKTCVGAEVPLNIPAPVQNRNGAFNPSADPYNFFAKASMWEGILLHLQVSMPSLDYYWMYMKEMWLPYIDPYQASAEYVKQGVEDLLLGVQAAKRVRVPLKLSTNGWTVSPKQDPLLISKMLPADVVVGALVPGLGTYPIEPVYANITQEKWPIVWLEDDASLTSIQLHVNRTLSQARDAASYGCQGLIGIHWRTKIIQHSTAAMAYSGWETVDLTEFMLDWVASQFGTDIGTQITAQIANLFLEIDGEEPIFGNCPGMLSPDSRPWASVSQQFAYVDEFLSYQNQIGQDAGSQSRFAYWATTFQYQRNLAQIQCDWAALSAFFITIENLPPSQQQAAAQSEGLPALTAFVALLTNTMELLEQSASTITEVGAIMNLQSQFSVSILPGPSLQLQMLLSPSSGESAVPLGCYVDEWTRDLSGASVTSAAMTVEYCAQYCGSQSYKYIGVQFSTSCFCGNSYGKYGPASSNSSCSMQCAGNPAEMCGGSYLNNIFDVTNWKPAPPLPSNATLPKNIAPGVKPKLWMPSAPGVVPAASNLFVLMLLISPVAPTNLTVYSRQMGVGGFALSPCHGTFTPSGWCALEISLPSNKGTVEYYAQAVFPDSSTAVWPPTAPQLNMITTQI